MSNRPVGGYALLLKRMGEMREKKKQFFNKRLWLQEHKRNINITYEYPPSQNTPLVLRHSGAFNSALLLFLPCGSFYALLGVLCEHNDATCLMDLFHNMQHFHAAKAKCLQANHYMTPGFCSKSSFALATFFFFKDFFFIFKHKHKRLSFFFLCSFLKYPTRITDALLSFYLADWSFSCSPEHKIKQNFNEAPEIVHLTPNQIFSDAFKGKPHLTLSDSLRLAVVWSLACVS